MISTVIAMALSMAAAKADPVDNARKAYSNCLIGLHNKSVSDKVSASDFNGAVSSGCATEKTVYRDLIIKAERGYGTKAADAEKYANEEAQSVIDMITNAFSENAESGAKMTPEK